MSRHHIEQLQAKLAELTGLLEHQKLMQQNWFSASDVFNSSSFYTKSEELNDYLREIQNNISRLESVTEQSHAEYLTERIAAQFSCFKNYANASYLSTKYSNQNKKHFSQVNRVKQMAARVTQSSQALYQELSKLQEYERRLLDMVAEKQAQLHQADNSNRTELQNAVLITQQRLGRCRKALSGVEEQIQALDKQGDRL